MTQQFDEGVSVIVTDRNQVFTPNTDITRTLNNSHFDDPLGSTGFTGNEEKFEKLRLLIEEYEDNQL
mgnify:CR=1 FL=1